MAVELSKQGRPQTLHRLFRARDQKPSPIQVKLAERSAELLNESNHSVEEKLRELRTSREGLSEDEAHDRLWKYGANEVAHELPPRWYAQLLGTLNNPFIIVLVVLAMLSIATDRVHLAGPAIIGVMIGVSVLIRFWQEYRSTRAVERLKAMVSTQATVIRREPAGEISKHAADLLGIKIRSYYSRSREVPLTEVVPGDIVTLAAGDMVPADVRLLRSKDLFVSQAVLTGESMSVEKYDTLGEALESRAAPEARPSGILDLPNLCFMGTSVISGTATAVVQATGADTYLGSLTKSVLERRPPTNFDLGVNRVTWLLVRFMLALAPMVLFINGFTKGDWRSAFFFALAVAVGLTPEMLPLIVSANLARGAIAMSRKKVIVKKLNAIQNLGAMDVLCADKTGTLTQDQVSVEQHVDVLGKPSREVLKLAYLNSFYQTGLKNLLDRAVLRHTELCIEEPILSRQQKVDEVPFDFSRRRMSVVVRQESGNHLIVCKGAVDEVMQVCSRVKIGNEVGPINEQIRRHVARVTCEMNQDGMRVIAVAYRETSADKLHYSVHDERDLILAGYIGFLDPPKETAADAIRLLQKHGITVKILTGDNELVARKVCRDVGLEIDQIVLGAQINQISDDDLAELTKRATIFANLNPLQKSRVVQSLKAHGHTVGFLGDGINDAEALRQADVGISVDTAVDIAKESADLILLEKNLLVIEQGVIQGRTTFGNIVKYLKMTISSNLGNALSVVVASVFIPFLPMLALQLLVQNLLYDLSQLSIPWDRMDEDFLIRPRQWDTTSLRNFTIFIGPVSCIFDFTTFWLMWHVFGANSAARQSLFQSGWFVEGLLSQTLIVHMIRTRKIPFVQSTAAPPVLILTATIMLVGIWIPFSPLARSLGMQPLPGVFFPWLVLTLLSYCALTQVVKTFYLRRFGNWL